MPRKYTNQLLDMVEDGSINPIDVITACVKYMSEDDVRDMMEANEYLFRVMEIDDECAGTGETNQWHWRIDYL